MQPSRDNEVLGLVLEELARARGKFPNLLGPHEGYAVLLEEVEELWERVKAHKHGREMRAMLWTERAAMRAECLQIAAMAVRFYVDLLGDPK